LFRRLFLEKLIAAHRPGELQFFGNDAPPTDRQAFAAFLAPLHNSKWVVYCKRPFGGPKQVFRQAGCGHKLANDGQTRERSNTYLEHHSIASTVRYTTRRIGEGPKAHPRVALIPVGTSPSVV
jgi:hypothetical protein